LAEDAIKAAVADYQNKHAQGVAASSGTTSVELGAQPICTPN
jgi:hypothetical protein